MKRIIIIALAVLLFTGIAFCQGGDELQKNVAKLSIPISWGHLAAAVPTEIGTLLYFEASNGDIHVIAQTQDLAHLISTYYVITRE